MSNTQTESDLIRHSNGMSAPRDTSRINTVNPMKLDAWEKQHVKARDVRSD